MDKYRPAPINTGDVVLPPDLERLTEFLAENAHDHWAQERISQGWQWGEKRNDELKTHPDLIAYAELPDSEKIYDRKSAMETLKVILKLGYRIARD